ncbi:SpaA isopeptide-forming pilin-related protein [Bifidobacterium pseudolongum]|uniref:SpaA isopeptide-forming pilin-related protein n=1 Tax=Bifidobacterium pseudolongum TaxID=1694 RepID=UPI001021102E|nr:SpaA isopeptide-forming pilin-related protein [Bifidobacterium pseudolongum]RYQ46112.1 Bacterial Ig-like domain (group 2) [Bifidobacterium pseudolongum subsp. globosum]
MRMKHGSDRGPTISMKPRLLAAFTAVAMMFATAVPALMPQTAQAAAALADGSKCTPQDVTIGSFEEDFRNPDVGIATYVGGNMFMGKPNNPATTSYGASPSQTAEQGNFSPSYAVEAEGTTLVAGKVINGNIKKSWGGIGFRFGTVGFGANYRPAKDSTVLAVGGGGNLTLTDRTGNDKTVFLAYGIENNKNTTGAGWAGYYKSKDQTTGPNYNMQINGPDAWPSVGGTSSRALFASNPGGGLANSTITFNKGNALSNVHIVGATRTDYSNFGTEIQNNSELMGQQKTTGTASSATAQYTTEGEVGFPTTSGEGSISSDGVFQTKYEKYNKAVNYTVQYGSKATQTDKLITFVGDKGKGNSPTQVFEIAGSKLANGYHIGTAFNFTNIPDNARIVVNVTGTGPITFHNSWRFFYEGKDISKGYINDNANKDIYSRIASRLTWNFKDTSYLTILGGQSAFDWDHITPTDDPAAAMLGSIYVPKGTFESHVTTNGRVYVGGDFLMYNPKKVKAFNQAGANDGASASVIDMDQERHNFPGGFSISSTCSSVSWDKVDPDGKNLGGTSWAVYGSKAAAQSGDTANALWTVTDNVLTTAGDYNPAEGVIEVSNLTPERSYYIREMSPNSTSYETNPNIYRINTGVGGNTYSGIEEVYDSKTGNTITTDKDKWLNNGKIENPRKGSNIQWGKYADGDTNHTGLRGSEWELSKDGKPLATIIDNTKSVESVAIMHDNQNVTGRTFELDVNESMDFTAAIEPSDAVQDVDWFSSDKTSVIVNEDGRVTVMQAKENQEPVTITAKSNSDPTKTAVVYIKPKFVAVNSLTVSPASLNLAPGASATLTATTDPEGVQVSWTSEDTNVAVVQVQNNGTATVTAGTTGGTSTTIVAKAGNKEERIPVTVQASGTTFYIENPDNNFWGNMHLYAWSGNTIISNAYPGTSVTEKVCANWYKIHLDKKGPYQVQVNFKTSSSDTGGHKTGDLNIGSAPNYKITDTHGSGKIEEIKEGIPVCPTSLEPEESANEAAALSEPADDAAAVQAAPVAQDTAGTTNTQYEDKDPRIGIFRIEGLADGTYTLQESKAPNGYWLNPQVYTITVSGTTVKWDPTPAGQLDANGIAWISDKPTQVAWQKGDSDNDNALLAGSGWTIDQMILDDDGEPVLGPDDKPTWKTLNEVLDCTPNSCDTSKKYNDENDAAGEFLVKYLPVGKYRISETTIPEGYKSVEDYYYFEITATAPDNNEGIVYINNKPLGNKRTTGTVNWKKVSSEDSAASKTPLAGSEWQLTYTSYDKITNSDDTTTPKETIICQLTDTGSSCTVNGESKNVAWAVDQDSDNGEFSYAKLPWGDYVIVETKAPDGYNLDTTEHRFTIGLGSTEENKFEVSLGDIENTPGVVLPATGGEGNTLIVLFGFALIAISMLGCGVAMRKRI